jgi:hypothetical protein
MVKWIADLLNPKVAICLLVLAGQIELGLVSVKIDAMSRAFSAKKRGPNLWQMEQGTNPGWQLADPDKE